jgi:cytochrome c peroxidase
VGVSDPAIARFLPVFTFRRIATGETVQTTDPGRALITGLWRDMSRFKVPPLRGLAARAPYFHNGSRVSLEALVNFYNQRRLLGLSAAQRADLAAFLKAL